jgi:DNA ligase-1
MRGYWTGTTLLSRQGNDINVPHWFIANWPNIAMDGELWIERGKFQSTISCIKRIKADNKCWHNIKFMLFDLPKNTSTFTQRIAAMKELIKHYPTPYINVVTQFKVNTIKALDEKLTDVINNGGEGLMLHYHHAYYTSGRNRHLMKLKHYQDAEAVVIEHIAGQGKYQGMLGALVVKTPENINFKIGSGFTDKQRSNPPPIGSIVTYKYTGKTLRGVPRFASFLRIRK